MKKKYHKVSKIYYYGFVCEQILHSDWLLKWARWTHLALSRSPTLFPQEKVLFMATNKSFINQACSVKMAGYWPHSFFAYYEVNFV